MRPEQLAEEFPPAYFVDLLDRGLLARGPDDARAKIAACCGSVPDIFGRGCAPFSALRERLHSLLVPHKLTNAAIFTAPHTHWDPGPIVYRRASDALFEVGPLLAHSELSNLIPVSFVVEGDGSLRPTEWCEAYADLQSDEYQTTVAKFAEFAQAAAEPGLCIPMSCFGLALNHRFKRLPDPPIFPTMEAPRSGQRLSTVTIDVSQDYLDLQSSNQVAWLISGFPELDEASMAVFRRLNGLISNIPAAAARSVHRLIVDRLVK